MKIYLISLLIALFIGCGDEDNTAGNSENKNNTNDTSDTTTKSPTTYYKTDSFVVKKGDKLKAISSNTKIKVIRNFSNNYSNVTVLSGSVSLTNDK